MFARSNLKHETHLLFTQFIDSNLYFFDFRNHSIHQFLHATYVSSSILAIVQMSPCQVPKQTIFGFQKHPDTTNIQQYRRSFYLRIINHEEPSGTFLTNDTIYHQYDSLLDHFPGFSLLSFVLLNVSNLLITLKSNEMKISSTCFWTQNAAYPSFLISNST